MTSLSRKFLYPFLLPNGLLGAALLFALQRDGLLRQVAPLLEVLPYAVLAMALLLGWRFNRTRLIYAAGLLGLLQVALTSPLLRSSALVLQVGQLLLPLNLLLVCLFRERGLLSPRSLPWLGLLAAQLATAAWLLKQHPARLAGWLNYQLVNAGEFQLGLSQPLLLINLLVLLLLLVRYLLKPAAFEASFFWAQLLLLVGFWNFPAQPLLYYLTGGGLLLVLGIMEGSHSLAYRDELTGLPGRRALNEALAKLGRRYTVAMLDIDHFKKFNDTHGHDVGDQVLRMVASRLLTVSGGGRVFRYGGEEFTILFPRKLAKNALPYLEEVRQTIEDARFIPRGIDRPKKKPKKNQRRKKSVAAALQVTISIGAAERSGKTCKADEVIKAADQALYRAKKAGRNRVEI